MTKYELSLSPNYVPSWTVVDAVRELFQNALDQQRMMIDNRMFFDFKRVDDHYDLYIGNKSSVLEPKTLLLGQTTKADRPDVIGKFGEGYKIAALVLTRLGKPMTIYNYGAKEVWKPRFSKSRKYGSDILVFEVTKNFLWVKAPDNNLTIRIEGITDEELIAITTSNLHLQTVADKYSTTFGNILLDEKFAKKVFVNGLYVCDYKEYTYGYDFNPQHIKLDRDRKLVSDFDLTWLASRMWASSNNKDVIKHAAELIGKGAADVKYIASMGYDNKAAHIAIADKALTDFRIKHGNEAVPVTEEDDVQVIISLGYKPIVIQKAVLQQSGIYTAPEPEKRALRDILREWRIKYEEQLSAEAHNEFEEIRDKVDGSWKI